MIRIIEDNYETAKYKARCMNCNSIFMFEESDTAETRFGRINIRCPLCRSIGEYEEERAYIGKSKPGDYRKFCREEDGGNAESE